MTGYGLLDNTELFLSNTNNLQTHLFGFQIGDFQALWDLGVMTMKGLKFAPQYQMQFIVLPLTPNVLVDLIPLHVKLAAYSNL